jgi:hypothetical protein
MKHTKPHPGFKAVAKSIAAQINPTTGKPYGPDIADRILAARSRNASPAAHRANPRLNRVKGK